MRIFDFLGKPILARFKTNKPILIIVPVVCAILAVTACVFFVTNKGTYKIAESIYRFENGVQLDYSGTTKIKRNENKGTFSLINHGDSVLIDDTPIYFKDDKNKLLIPNQMIAVLPEKNKMGRTGYNTIIKDVESPTAIMNKEKVSLGKGILFDGKDTYVFLDSVNLKWDLKEQKMPAFSYAVVHAGIRFEAYSPDGEIKIVEQIGDSRVKAESVAGVYSIDLSTDILFKDGGEVLLTTEPSLYQKIK